MRPISLAAAVAAALGSTSVLAAPPTTPSDLRVDVYSGTAAELFWSRSSDPDGAVSGYEIRRDGQLVETRDGLSYFTDSLTEGRAFAFTVTAVDFDGERSAPASVSVVGGDRDGSVGAGGGRPPPPANLTSSVYSSSAAEVFWDRSDQPGLSYEVSVDGGPVTTTDGTSAFLSGLDGARGRGVDVVAIDANGQRSGAANVTLGGSGSGGGSDVPAPSSLRAELYSGSAGEVFWDRVPGANLSYEVRLDGETVATTNGTSYFVGGRPGLDGTSVEVLAIGPDGTRSSASSTTLGSGGPSDPDPDPGTDAPPAPANARLEVYSSTAAELFFDRAPASANVVETEIVRDGEVLGTTNGTSFFDDTRQPGREYGYELTAIDASGNRSATTTVGEASDDDPTNGSGDVPQAVLTSLDTLFEAVNGDAQERMLAILTRITEPEAEGLSLLSSAYDDEFFATRDTYECPAGGTVDTAIRQLSGSGYRVSTNAENCEFPSFTVSGEFLEILEINRNVSASVASSFTSSVDDYVLIDSTDSAITTADGLEVASIASADTESRFLPVAWSTTGLSVERDDASYSLDSLATTVRDNARPLPDDRRGLTITIEGLVGPGGDPSDVTTVEPLFRGDEDANYTSGSIERVGASIAYTLDADGGDPDTFVLNVRDGQATTSYVVPWSGRFDFERIDTDGVQFGF